MYQLDLLQDYLMDAYCYLKENRLSSARLSLTACLKLLRPIKDDYSDTRNSFDHVSMLIEALKKYPNDKEMKEAVMKNIESEVKKVMSWIDCRKKAA